MMPCQEWHFVASQLLAHEWIFAKTMPHTPHWYTLRSHWSEDQAFTEVVSLLRQYGYPEVYQRRRYTMLDVNEHKYWTMGAPVGQTILINRKIHAHAAPYDVIAATYDGLFADAASRAEDAALMTLLPALRGRVLDIGCGTGLLLEYRSPAAYVGIDPSAAMLAQCAAKHPRYATALVQTGFESFWAANRFETIVSLYGAMNYVCPATLDRLSTFLAPGGQYFLMFFAPHYVPVTHQQEGLRLPYYMEGWRQLAGTVTPWQNYLLVTGP